jgi:hypothetical protein
VKLSKVVPWGRSLNEYSEMFLLSENDLNGKILGCGDGPACFNAQVSRNGGNVISADPIRSRIDEVYPQIMEQMSKNKDDYVWKSIRSVEELGKVRLDAMKLFLADYEQGKKSGRYIMRHCRSCHFRILNLIWPCVLIIYFYIANM